MKQKKPVALKLKVLKQKFANKETNTPAVAVGAVKKTSKKRFRSGIILSSIAAIFMLSTAAIAYSIYTVTGQNNISFADLVNSDPEDEGVKIGNGLSGPTGPTGDENESSGDVDQSSDRSSSIISSLAVLSSEGDRQFASGEEIEPNTPTSNEGFDFNNNDESLIVPVLEQEGVLIAEDEAESMTTESSSESSSSLEEMTEEASQETESSNSQSVSSQSTASVISVSTSKDSINQDTVRTGGSSFILSLVLFVLIVSSIVFVLFRNKKNQLKLRK